MKNHGCQKRNSNENKVRTILQIMVTDYLNKNLCQQHSYFGWDFYHAGLRYIVTDTLISDSRRHLPNIFMEKKE